MYFEKECGEGLVEERCSTRGSVNTRDRVVMIGAGAGWIIAAVHR
jgi:hypothetical protein